MITWTPGRAKQGYGDKVIDVERASGPDFPDDRFILWPFAEERFDMWCLWDNVFKIQHFIRRGRADAKIMEILNPKIIETMEQ